MDLFVTAISTGSVEARSSSVTISTRQPLPQLDAMVQIDDWLLELQGGFLGVGRRQSGSNFGTQIADIVGVAV